MCVSFINYYHFYREMLCQRGVCLCYGPVERRKWYCEDLYHDKEGKGIEQEYWEQEPPPLHSEVLMPSARQQVKATGPDEVPAELFNAGGEIVLERMHRICLAIWETGDQRNGHSPHSSQFPRKVILHSVQITEQLLLSHIQARSFFRSYWKGSEGRPKQKLRMNRWDSDKVGGRDQITNLRILIHKAREHQQQLYFGGRTTGIGGSPRPSQLQIQPTRSTQPCIPPGSLNRVPALAAVRVGMSPLPGGR